MINLTLKLFNCVVKKDGTSISIDFDNGLIIDKEASWASNQIKEYYTGNRLKGDSLNKTFHKSWGTILNSTREELLVHQLAHYLSTYGSDFKGEVYIPDEVLSLEGTSLKFITITSYSESELVEKCLSLLKNGIALGQETIETTLELLSSLGYVFTSLDGIKNKEASVLISDKFGIYPTDPLEGLRYAVYKSTGETLLIKSVEVIEAIKESKFNPEVVFNSIGLIEMSKVFNRFKPIFLAYKKVCPKIINKLSKLSKKHHVPLVVNPLNLVTSLELTEKDTHWLDNASVFSLFKALNACKTRIQGQTDFVYRIRNGKSFTKKSKLNTVNVGLLNNNYNFILSHLKDKVDLTGKKYLIPSYISYTLPTSEKMFVGNIPTGTKVFGEKLAVGIYWENSWGASDLDLSGVNLSGKVGWNSDYNQNDELLYSGDMTNATEGAVEYLHCSGKNIPPTMVQNNVYSGESDCKYKIVVGLGDEVTRDYMMNPENVLFEVVCNSVQSQMYLGLIQSHQVNNSFTLLNFASGNARIGGESELSTISCNALVTQYNNQLSLKDLLVHLGATVVDTLEEGAIDLSPNVLQKDTLISIFE